MGTHEHSFPAAARTPFQPRVRVLTLQASKGAPLDCGAVAKRRARRYLAKRRLPKGVWPIIAAVILIAIVFDRQIQPALARPFLLSGRTGKNDPLGDDEPTSHPLPIPAETGAALHGQASLRCEPPADFQAKHAAQVLAFLIRNRGKLDNTVVREKWELLDRVSLPLAIYLRDIEASEEWSALEAEISRCPLSPDSAAGRPDMPSSLRHRRILELMQEWQRRGEKMLVSPNPEAVDSLEPENPDLKDDDDGPPKP